MQLHTISDYDQLRLNTLKEYERDVLYAYVDTEKIATIGIGLNLRIHGMLVLQALGFDITESQLTGMALQTEREYIENFVRIFNTPYTPNNTTANQALVELNKLLKKRAENLVYANPQNFVNAEAYTAFHNTQSFLNQTFYLPSTTVSENLFNLALDGYIEPGTGNRKEGYEELVDKWLQRTGVGAKQSGLFNHNNRERLALLSLAFNSRTYGIDRADTPWNDIGLPTLLGPNLTKALISDNRAEAWYEIRYNSNLNGIHANRRYQEADLFGLYDTDPSNVTEAEAKEIMRMYTIHEIQENDPKKKMLYYESTTMYPPPSDIGGIAYAINEAKKFLTDNYAMGNTIDGEVMVGAGLESYDYKEKGFVTDVLMGTFGNDLMFGEKGNDIILGSFGDDVIYGGEGDDHITGGLGNDLLYGGADNDTYYVNAGDGVDTIEDKEGINKVILCGKEINFFYEVSSGQYKSPDGTLDGVMSGGDFIVTCNDGTTTTTVILNEDFQWGDFGIELKDLPDNPATTNIISGDLLPKDFDPEKEGIQSQDDEWGNVITDGQPAPGRKDALYDTTANDLLDGKAGNDFIVSERGGNDWVKGGEGNDYIIANYNSNDVVIECGPGEDIVFGGRGNDKIYCDAYGETDELIAAGEIAENIDARGNAVSGGALRKRI